MEKHYLQKHWIGMGTEMTVAFAVFFMAHTEKQVLAISPHKDLIWKRFLDDIFLVWTLPKAEFNNLIDLANSFHTNEMSSEEIVFLDT